MKKIKNFILSLGLISIFYENVSDSKLINLYKDFSEYNKKTIEEIILERAKESQTIMFGDNHAPIHLGTEVLIKKLMPPLKELGFNYFAIELSSKAQKIIDDAANKKIDSLSYSEKISKIEEWEMWWSNNYHYDLIKEATKNGFKIIAYDTWDLDKYPKGSPRDKKEFENLEDLIFKKDKNARIIIYCGNNHISESEIREKKEVYIPLGKHLNEYTKGKNLSLSIDSKADDPDIYIKDDKITIYR